MRHLCQELDQHDKYREAAAVNSLTLAYIDWYGVKTAGEGNGKDILVQTKNYSLYTHKSKKTLVYQKGPYSLNYLE